MARIATLHLSLWLLALVAMSPVSMYRQRRCATTNAACLLHPCCKDGDICMTSYLLNDDGLHNRRCITWRDSWIIRPRIFRGQTCTDSFQCVDRCCREYRAHRQAPVYECGTPYNYYPRYPHDCMTNRNMPS